MNATDITKLSASALDRLMPMHLTVSAAGLVMRTGPTLAKLLPNFGAEGCDLFDLMEVVRPTRVCCIADLCADGGASLHLRLRDHPRTRFKGLAVQLPGSGGYLVNLSFGIAVADAVRDHTLTQSDFADTDLTVEMLYLIEAKTAVMNESRNLNLRLQSARIDAEEKAFTDTLTGLRNRRAMDHVLACLLGQGARFALMHLDLDYFKDVNDSFGHAAGDRVLQVVASVLIAETRSADTVARIGGDEFVIIFDRQEDPSALTAIAERIIERIEQPIAVSDRSCRISGSAGIVISTHYVSPTAELMLADADAALYASKHDGRGCVTLGEGLPAAESHRAKPSERSA